jgi:hypothetical protein
LSAIAAMRLNTGRSVRGRDRACAVQVSRKEDGDQVLSAAVPMTVRRLEPVQA